MPKLKKRVSKDFTTIHNTMIRDMNLGATERGVLLTMLSLPDNWDFSIKGLTSILPDGYTKISTSLKKLEKAGYLIRQRVYSDGKICDWEYTFSDEPMDMEAVENDDSFCPQEADNQEMENLESENLIQGPQILENRRANKINKNQIKKNQVSMNQISINPSASDSRKNVENPNDGSMDGYAEEKQIYTEVVRENISYQEYREWIEMFANGYMTVGELDEIVEMIVRAICSRKPVERICGQDFPREVIQSAMLKVDRTCLENAIETMKQTDNIRNYERYLISTLFNEANGRHFKENAEERNIDYAIRRDFGDPCDGFRERR